MLFLAARMKRYQQSKEFKNEKYKKTELDSSSTKLLTNGGGIVNRVSTFLVFILVLQLQLLYPQGSAVHAFSLKAAILNNLAFNFNFGGQEGRILRQPLGSCNLLFFVHDLGRSGEIPNRSSISRPRVHGFSVLDLARLHRVSVIQNGRRKGNKQRKATFLLYSETPLIHQSTRGALARWPD